VKRSIAIALFAILSSTPLSAVWAIQIENYGIGKGDTAKADITNAEIAKALSDPPNVPPESENLVRNFLDHTLPHLLADDERLAYQLGLGDSSSDPILIDRRLPIMLIRRDDVMKLLARTAESIDLVNNPNNWTKDKDRRLVPHRIVFSLRRNTSASDAASPSWSSVTLEQSGEGSWRIIQAGAPKLSRAMTLHKDKDTRINQFLLWIPDLNRHYLGKIEGNSIVLTVLFYDPLTRSEPGKHQRITDEFLQKLKQLYEKLELPKKLKGQTGLAQTRPDQSNQAQPPAQAQ
jgi:hypothetical protein